MRNVSLDVDDRRLDDVITQVGKGKYRIPEFQREFVWDRTDVVDLFDSIYKSYPIGSFFFWRVPHDMWDFFRDVDELQQPSLEEIQRSEFPEISFVLDGQQRLTSLYVTLNGMKYADTDYSRIVFDLDEETFKVAEGKADHLVRVCDIWDDKREVRDELEGDRYEAFTDCNDALTKYELPLIIVKTNEVESVINIFERINQKGTRLSRFDIVNANIWSRDFNLRSRIDEDIFEHLDQIGFGEIDRGTVTQTLALNIDGTCSTDAQKNLDPDDVRENWEDTKEAMISAIGYLRKQHGVKRSEFIPYEGMIPVLAYYMYETDRRNVDPDHQEQIDRWFWRVALSGRYSSSAQTRMTEDSKLIDRIIAGEDVEINFTPQISTERLKTTNIKRSTSGLRNAFLCLLARNRPLHFEDGSEIDLTENEYADFRLNKHHIFPNAYLRGLDYSKKQRKSIMDITFIPAELNRRLSDTSAKEYFGRLANDVNEFERIMDSHLIPHDEDSGIWDNDYDTFQEQRAELVYSEFMELIGEYSALESDLRNDPQSAVKETEVLVRDFIDTELTLASDGGTFWGEVPNDVNSNVQRRISEEQDSNPEFTVDSDRDKLDFCNVMDYAKIINARWDVFGDYLPSKSAVQTRFEDFAEFRNAIAHHREIDRFTEMDGQVAIEWINSCISEEY
ncbi:GmrSD restriction endonuclease domain-containing protein [Halorubrum trueperi]|uniref:DUF262 domain-containing protein n=1 Tax=Halorubrum trueperi TaxID=2004704 RepID=A0ABD5UG88_9EURY